MKKSFKKALGRFKGLKMFKGLRVERLKQKLGSLEVLKFGGIKRRLSQSFACADFIFLQASKLPSCQTSERNRFAIAFTMADRRSSRFHILSCALAFTMAEILISLTIIGVIAAITLPALQANINESAWRAQRKALYSRMSQAISMLPSLNGYGTYAGSWSADSVTVTADTAAQAFVTEGLNSVLQISNICNIPANTSSENARKELKKCGIPEKLTTMSNSKIDFPTKISEMNNRFIRTLQYTAGGTIFHAPQENIDTVAAAFETKNGESIAVFYNPYCWSKEKDNPYPFPLFNAPFMCANFIYDLNGRKGPNKVGKDIGFITALYPTDSEVIAPMPITMQAKLSTYDNAAAVCRNIDKNSRLPNKYELAAMYYNKNLLKINANNDYAWSSTLYDADKSWGQLFLGESFVQPKDTRNLVYCIKR